MMMQTQTDHDAPLIVGALPDGVDRALAEDAGRRIRDEFRVKGDGARLRSLRFVPSSLIRTGADMAQFVVNAAVEPLRNVEGRALSRAKVVDSIVTVDLGSKHRVTRVLVPFLEPDAG